MILLLLFIIIRNPKIASLVAVVAQTEQMKTVIDTMWSQENTATTVVIYQWTNEINNNAKKNWKKIIINNKLNNYRLYNSYYYFLPLVFAVYQVRL